MNFRWYRQSLPTRSVMIAGIACILFADLCALSIVLLTRPVIDADLMPLLIRPLIATVVVASAVPPCFLAGYRLIRFPDGAQSDYAQWLARSPWTAEQRTPFGPWHPVKEDVVPIGLLSLLAVVRGSVLLLLPSVSVVTGYEAWHLLLLICVGQPVAFVLTWAIVGLTIICRRWDWSVYSVLMISGLVGHLYDFVPDAAVLVTAGLLAALPSVVYRRMNVELTVLQPDVFRGWDPHPPQRTPVFKVLSPQGKPCKLSLFLRKNRPRAFAFGVLSLVGLTTIPGRVLAPILAAFAVFLPLVRVAIFQSRHNTHLGVLARYRLKRWLIPEFDRIWLPVLWAAIAYATIFLLGWLTRLPPGIMAAFAVSAVVAICLRSGPDFHEWSLTAPVSISVRGPSSTKRGEQRCPSEA